MFAGGGCPGKCWCLSWARIGSWQSLLGLDVAVVDLAGLAAEVGVTGLAGEEKTQEKPVVKDDYN